MGAKAGSAAGFPDPLLASQLGPKAPAAQVSLTYAFSAQDAPLAAFGLDNYTQLGPLLSPLIHQPSVATGKAAHQDPTSVRPLACMLEAHPQELLS